MNDKRPEIHTVDAPFVSDLVPTADGSATLHHPIYDQTYHSHHGAVTESKHVFLDHSGLQARLAASPTSLLEIGIGTGLNLALSASLALREEGTLHYEGIEQFPPDTEALRALDYARFPEIDAELWERCLHAFEHRLPALRLPNNGHILCHWTRFETLDLGEERFDIIYHDAFSPDVNPELWTIEALTPIIRAMKPGAVLVTYTVQGDVRRRLQSLGLEVERLPGPVGGKRQVLRATRTL